MRNLLIPVLSLGFAACAQVEPSDDSGETPFGRTESELSQLSGALVGLAGKCLNVEGAKTTNGTRVIIWDCVDASNEKWTFGSYNKIVGLGGKCLTASGSTSGSNVTLSTCTSSAMQKWVRDSNTHLRNLGTNMCLNVYGGYSTSGTRTIVWPCTGNTPDDSPANDNVATADSDNEKWFLEPNVTLPVEAVAVSDADGSRPGTVTAAQFATTLAQVNNIYRQAHIQFTFDPNKDFTRIYDTDINNLECAQGDQWTRIGRTNFQSFKFKNKIVVLLRNGLGNSPLGISCSAPPWAGGNAVVFRNYFSNDTYGLLAHELGHYLGLDHPFNANSDDGMALGTYARLSDVLSRRGTEWFNADGISDTPPDPETQAWQNILGMSVCGGGNSAVVAGYTLAPERTNVMGYYGCTPQHFSRKQRLKMRRALAHPLRRHLTELPQLATVRREIFGQYGYCLGAEPSVEVTGFGAILTPCTSNTKFTFGANGQIVWGSYCLTESLDSSIWARPYFDFCNNTTAQRWTRDPSGRILSYGGRSLDGDPNAYNGKVFQSTGSLGPEMIWGSFYPLPVAPNWN